MRLSLAICREQEAKHRAIAENDPLESRRSISLTAADAWAREIKQAERMNAKVAALADEHAAQSPERPPGHEPVG